MKTELTYESVPTGYAHCFHHQCVLKDKCTHYLAGSLMTSLHPIINTINLLAVPEDTSQCKQFYKVQTIKIAWGLKNIFNNLNYITGKKVKLNVIRVLGRSQYYRFFRQEYGMDPRIQQTIKSIFERYKIKEEPAYERYTMEYKWNDTMSYK